MGEHLADVLLKTADVLHWLGRFNECNALILLSRFLHNRGITSIEKLEVFVTSEEAAGPLRPVDVGDFVEILVGEARGELGMIRSRIPSDLGERFEVVNVAGRRGAYLPGELQHVR